MSIAIKVEQMADGFWHATASTGFEACTGVSRRRDRAVAYALQDLAEILIREAA